MTDTRKSVYRIVIGVRNAIFKQWIASNSCEISEFILKLKNHLEFLKLF